MAKTALIPEMHPKTKKVTTREVERKIVLLYVGAYQHKFMIHPDRAGAPILADYRTGYKLCALNGIKVLSLRTGMTDRTAAVFALANIVERNGVDKVREQLALHPTLNK